MEKFAITDVKNTDETFERNPENKSFFIKAGEPQNYSNLKALAMEDNLKYGNGTVYNLGINSQMFVGISCKE